MNLYGNGPYGPFNQTPPLPKRVTSPVSYGTRWMYLVLGLTALGIATGVLTAFVIVTIQSHNNRVSHHQAIKDLRKRLDDLEALPTMTTASYLVQSPENNLTCSRQLIHDSANFDVIDNGCGSNVTVDLSLTGVTQGDYDLTSLSVDEYGRITNASTASLTCGAADTASPYFFASDLILLYTFKELEGSFSQDLSGFGTPTNIQNGPISSGWHWRYPCGVRTESLGTVWRTGDGTGTDSTADKITDAIKLSGEYSIEIWLQTHDTSQTGPARIMSIGSGGTACSSDDTAIMLGQSGDNFVWRLPVNPSSCNEQVVINSLDTNHLRMQFVITFNGSEAKIYHNAQNELTSTVTSGISTWTSTYELSLFNSPWLSAPEKRPWLGVIHKLAIWNRTLTADEVITTFKSGPCYPRTCNCNCNVL